MKLGTRIFIANLVIVALCFSYPVYWAWTNLRTRYLESVEDPLVDQANILASLVAMQMQAGRFRPEEFHRAFENMERHPVNAKIYNLVKRGVDTGIYITNEKGIVIFDSEDGRRVGQDFSNWLDVSRTLRGEYGARTTRRVPDDPTTSVLHVAAPIMINGKIAGVLTVTKPAATINDMILGVKPLFTQVFGISAVVAIALMLMVSYWLSLPIKRLTRYANQVRAGKRVSFPALDESEIGEMGHAFERMREALEGKKYVEEYVHTLTHEIKSPLSAIRGAAELLEEKMEPERRERFLMNIRNEVNRIQDIVDRMLELSVLENRKELDKRERVSLTALLNTVIESKHAMLEKENIEIVTRAPDEAFVVGDAFLLHQAVANLIQNAIDFSPQQSRIELSAIVAGDKLRLVVRDFGPGVPEYAKAKVFDKFYSLQRPGSGKKSTGLGLNFVKEVATLHGGTIEIANCPDGGLSAELTLPATMGTE
jgi:two-component system sensor histidine kinase CreC